MIGADDVDLVDVQEVVAAQCGEIGMVGELGGAGIVDEDVDASPFRNRLIDDAAAVRVVRDIALAQERFNVLRLRLRGGCFRFL